MPTVSTTSPRPAPHATPANRQTPLTLQVNNTPRSTRETVGMEHCELLVAADRNVAAVLRHFAVHAHGAVLSESPAVLLVAAAAPFPGAFHNGAIRLDPGASASKVLEELRSFSDQRSRDMTLWASAHHDDDLVRAATAAGLRFRSTTVGMAIEKTPAEPVASDHTELVRVTDATDLAEFAAVHEQVFRDRGRPVEPVAHFASPGALLAPNTAAFVARTGGRPVACAMVVMSGAEAGVYWVATRPDARRQGFGELVTRAAVRAGFERGARVVVLQATEQGAPLYRRLGFSAFTEYARYG